MGGGRQTGTTALTPLTGWTALLGIAAGVNCICPGTAPVGPAWYANGPAAAN